MKSDKANWRKITLHDMQGLNDMTDALKYCMKNESPEVYNYIVE